MDTLPNEIEVLKREICDLGDLVQQSISQVIEALVRYDPMLAKAVIAADVTIDRREIDVEQHCIDILAQHCPAGEALRFVVAVLKINNDLERVGDLAVNVAKTVVHLVDCERFQRVGKCEAMAHRAQAMVRNSLQALVNYDAKLARQVIHADNEVDQLQRTIQRRIEKAIDREPENIRPMMQLDFVIRQLERVADMATNIAEDVIYLVDGKIVRHEAVQQQANGWGTIGQSY